MAISKLALFASGVFFGGAVDHAILAAMRRDVTPYGLKAGVSGNWLFAVADLLAAAVLYRVHATREMRLTDSYPARGLDVCGKQTGNTIVQAGAES